MRRIPGYPHHSLHATAITLINHASKKLTDMGITVYYGMDVTDLVTTDDVVTRVSATDGNGDEVAPTTGERLAMACCC